MRVTFRRIDEAGARAILSWRYEGMNAFYNDRSDRPQSEGARYDGPDPDDSSSELGNLLDPRNRYYTIVGEQSEVVGFFCLGPDARVPGGEYHHEEALDVGLGLRPDLTGKGLGAGVLRAVLEFARQEYAPTRFRATIAAFNTRAIRVYEKIGFRALRSFTSSRDATGFVQMIVDAS